MNKGLKMKVGTSLSRCVRDIYKDVVDINDVMVIVARTDIDPFNDKHWDQLWEGYGGGHTSGSIWSNPEWSGIPPQDEQKVRDICIELYKRGKLHQPRQFGARPQRMDQYWYDVILTPDDLTNNPAAEEAWNNYKIAAKLGSVKKAVPLVFNDNF